MCIYFNIVSMFKRKHNICLSESDWSCLTKYDVKSTDFPEKWHNFILFCDWTKLHFICVCMYVYVCVCVFVYVSVCVSSFYSFIITELLVMVPPWTWMSRCFCSVLTETSMGSGGLTECMCAIDTGMGTWKTLTSEPWKGDKAFLCPCSADDGVCRIYPQ